MSKCRSMLTTFPLVYVEWEDSVHDGHWSDIADEESHEATIVASVGWLVTDLPTHMTVAASVNPEGRQIGNKQYIPKKLIHKVKYLRVKVQKASGVK